jgi:hypothetical protein
MCSLDDAGAVPATSISLSILPGLTREGTHPPDYHFVPSLVMTTGVCVVADEALARSRATFVVGARDVWRHAPKAA